MTQPVAFNACRMTNSCRVTERALGWGGVTGLFSSAVRGFGRIPSLDLITARSIRFCSSRMFSGQEYEIKAASVLDGKQQSSHSGSDERTDMGPRQPQPVSTEFANALSWKRPSD